MPTTFTQPNLVTYIECTFITLYFVLFYFALIKHTSLLYHLQVKADRGSKRLGVLQQASRHVNEMAAGVVASTKTGLDQIEDKGKWDVIGAFVSWLLMLLFNKKKIYSYAMTHLLKKYFFFFFSCAYQDTMDFSGMSLIKLKKEEMEAQVCILVTCFMRL